MNSFSPFDAASTSDDNRPGSSTSGSEDGSHYALYSDAQRNETDPEDEPNSLTSQTLNADGTPKRPMNAFMIFARRRRPQLSAENQSMRTGEVSKILSKEWNNMPAIEKQFYLDQAKQLKDTFNSRYPDYVYRRRPNNSRKRRRGDVSGSRQHDASHTSDGGEDGALTGDLGESSHTDGEDSQHGESKSDTHATAMSHDTSQSYSSSPSFSFAPSELSYRQQSHTPFPTSDRIPHHLAVPPRPHSGQGNPNYTYLPNNQTPTQLSVYGEQQRHNDTPWDVRLNHVRSMTSNWLGSIAHRPSITTALSGLKSHSYPSASTSTPTSAWPSSASTSNVTSASTATSASSYASFPTLSSPFYPNQQPMSNMTSPDYTSPVSSLAGQFGASRPFAFAPSPTMSPPPNGMQQHYATGRDSSLFSSLNQRAPFSGPSGLPRALPPPSFSNLPPLESPSSTSEVPQISGFWARDKIEGH